MSRNNCYSTFRFTAPYYALIVAQTGGHAIALYQQLLQQNHVVQDVIAVTQLPCRDQDALADLKQSARFIGSASQPCQVIEPLLEKYATKEEVLLCDPVLKV